MWVLCILIFVWCMCCMFGVCMMPLSHSLPCVHVRPLVHINHTPMLGVCMIVVCIWWVVSLWMWNVSLGWIYASFLLSFCVFLVMFVVKRLARSEIRGCCRCIDVRYACAWPEVKMPYCLHVSEVFLNVSFFWRLCFEPNQIKFNSDGELTWLYVESVDAPQDEAHGGIRYWWIWFNLRVHELSHFDSLCFVFA